MRSTAAGSKETQGRRQPCACWLAVMAWNGAWQSSGDWSKDQGWSWKHGDDSEEERDNDNKSKDQNWSWNKSKSSKDDDDDSDEEWDDDDKKKEGKQSQSTKDTGGKKKKRVLEDGSEVDPRHWSKSQTYREKIRAPLLARISVLQKELDTAISRATAAETERFNIGLQLTAMQTLIQAQRLHA